MNKRLFSMLCIVGVLVLSMIVYPITRTKPVVPETKVSKTDQILVLFGTRLIGGTEKGLELDRQSTRAEAAVLLTRLSGEERSIGALASAHSFSDVPVWVEAYASYVHSKGLLEGESDTLFQPFQAIDKEDYILALVQLLGYKDDGNVLRALQQGTSGSFNREEMLAVTYTALQMKRANEEMTQGEYLQSKGIFDRKTALCYQLIPEERQTERDAVLLEEIRTQQELPLEERLETQDYLVWNTKTCLELHALLDDRSKPYFLVNKTHLLDEEYVPELGQTDALPAVTEQVQAHPALYKALQELFATAEKSGVRFYNSSGYRSYRTQLYLYGNGEDEYVAPPGASEHQTGLAMDVTGSQKALDVAYRSSAEAKWLRNQSYKFGLLVRYPEGEEAVTGYPGEWWHLRYIGKAIAYECQRHGLVLEEFYGVTDSIKRLANSSDL